MKNHDYIPLSDRGFLVWSKNLIGYTGTHVEDWGVDPAALTALTQLYAAYDSAMKRVEDPNRGRTDVLAKNQARDALKKAARQFVKEYLEYNHRVTDEERDRMDLPIHDTHPTPKPKPHSRPAIDAKSSNTRQHTVSALNQSTGKKSKPDDAYGIKYVWEMRETSPDSPGDLHNAIFSRKTTQVFDFEEVHRGKKVFYAAQYENAKGETGPWSDLVELIIS